MTRLAKTHTPTTRRTSTVTKHSSVKSAKSDRAQAPKTPSKSATKSKVPEKDSITKNSTKSANTQANPYSRAPQDKSKNICSLPNSSQPPNASLLSTNASQLQSAAAHRTAKAATKTASETASAAPLTNLIHNGTLKLDDLKTPSTPGLSSTIAHNLSDKLPLQQRLELIGDHKQTHNALARAIEKKFDVSPDDANKKASNILTAFKRVESFRFEEKMISNMEKIQTKTVAALSANIENASVDLASLTKQSPTSLVLSQHLESKGVFADDATSIAETAFKTTPPTISADLTARYTDALSQSKASVDNLLTLAKSKQIASHRLLTDPLFDGIKRSTMAENGESVSPKALEGLQLAIKTGEKTAETSEFNRQAVQQGVQLMLSMASGGVIFTGTKMALGALADWAIAHHKVSYANAAATHFGADKSLVSAAERNVWKAAIASAASNAPGLGGAVAKFTKPVSKAGIIAKTALEFTSDNAVVGYVTGEVAKAAAATTFDLLTE